MQRAGRTAFWFLLAAIPATLVSSYFAFPVPLAATLTLAAFALLAFRRPADAVLVLAALAPVASAIQILAGLPYDGAALIEVFALTLLGAAALRGVVRQAPIVTSAFDGAAIAFIAVVAASCAAQLPTVILAAGIADPARALAELATSRYFLHETAFVSVERCALLIEGAAVAALVTRVVRTPAEALRVSNAVVLGGVAAAILNTYRLVEVSLRNPPFVEAFWKGLQTLRFNTQHGDLNAAGSYFAMVAILAACRAGSRTAAGRLHAAAVPLLLLAIWTSGSRVALATTLLGAAAALVLRRYGASVPRIRLRTAAIAASGCLTLILLVVFLLPVTRHGTFGFSVNTRLELLRVGGRMMLDRPFFGVGPSRFYGLFPQYTSPELQRAFELANGRPIPRENAHNQFLQIGAELGVVGLTTFLLILALALKGHWPSSRWPVVAGLLGFLVTALAGHPLLIPLVAWPFWIVTGLAAAGGEIDHERAGRGVRRGVSTLVVVLIATMPWRWTMERRDAILSDVTIGLSGWERDENGTRFQRGGVRSSLFVSRDSAVVRIPLRSGVEASHRVDVLLDGRTAAAVIVVPDRWTELTLQLQAGGDVPAYRRIDLIVADAPAGEGSLMVGRLVERMD